MKRLVEFGADVNASNACWFRSVLSWAANNARVKAIEWLLDHGALPESLDSLHAAAWGGSSCGAEASSDYAMTLRMLIEAGADRDDRRHCEEKTPLRVALESGNQQAITFLRSVGAREK
jgi:ankyrin repeat protein